MSAKGLEISQKNLWLSQALIVETDIKGQLCPYYVLLNLEVNAGHDSEM